ncbi:MAG: alginate export family protein [Candidatus Omnitrophota bacterium]
MKQRQVRVIFIHTICIVLFYWLVMPVFAFDEKGLLTRNFAGWNFKLGLNERFRQEYKRNFDFNKSLKDNGCLFFNRVMVNLKASFKDISEVFVEGLDAQEWAYHIKPIVNQRDNFDLHQLFLRFNNIGSQPVDFKAGRQEIQYGKGRLIAAPIWSNAIRSFDAIVLHIHPQQAYYDFLFAEVVKYNTDNFNKIQHKEKLMGAYVGCMWDKIAMFIEGYFLPQIIRGDAKTSRYTVGSRIHGKLFSNLLYDFELPYQFGKTAGKTIKAYAIHFDLTAGYSSVPLGPVFNIIYNQASGDKNPNDKKTNTFIPLYQSTHAPYGLMDFFRWENMREFAAKITLNINQQFRIIPQTNFFWLMSKNDSWYNSSGTALRTKTTGDRDYYVGQEISLRIQYDFIKNIKLEVGGAHFFTGGYVKDTGPNNDADWLYAQISFKI